MEKELFVKYYLIFIFLFFGSLALLLVVPIDIILKNVTSFWWIFFAVLVTIFGSSFLTIRLIPFFKDFRDVIKKKYHIFTGIVVSYKKGEWGDEQIEYYPIIRDEITGKEEMFVLHGKGTKLGGKYTIYYLKNTRLCVIAEKH